MSQLGENRHATYLARAIVDQFAPLSGQKNLALAELLGLLIGAVGVGVCLRSRKDPLSCILLLVGRSIAIPGLAAVPGLLSAGYGIYRAYSSYEKLDTQTALSR